MSLQSITQELYLAFGQEDYDKSLKLLTPVKIELIKHKLLIPIITPSTTKDQLNDFKISQKILEIGALSSLLTHNYTGFENYYSQLKPFYSNPALHSNTELDSASTKIISLYLVYVLSKGLISNFHVELEYLSNFGHFDLENDKYLTFPINLEKNLMEGNYIKIWNLLKDESNLPCKEYTIFIDTLVTALRFEIAQSLERSYNTIPISNCKNLLYYPQELSDSVFEANLKDDLGIENWIFHDGYILFANDDNVDVGNNTSKIINSVLNYADQIESII